MGYAEILIRQMGITDEMIHKYREKFTHDGLGACLKALARRGWLAAEPVYTSWYNTPERPRRAGNCGGGIGAASPLVRVPPSTV